jgi:hypothetical protein
VYVCILPLVIQYAKSMHLHHTFPRHLINGMIFGDTKFTEYKMCVLIFSTTLVISHSKNDSARYYHKCTQVLMWSTNFLSDFNQTWNLFNRYLKSPQISNFTKIHPAGAELFHADRWTTDRHDEDNSHFYNFANAPNK